MLEGSTNDKSTTSPGDRPPILFCPSRIGETLCCLPTWHVNVPDVRQHAWSDGKRFVTWDGES